MSDNSDDAILRFLEQVLGVKSSRRDKPGGMTPLQFKKMVLESYDTASNDALRAALHGKSIHKVLCSLFMLTGEAIAQTAGDEESVCDASMVMGDLIHDYAHYCYRVAHKGEAKPTHEAPECKQ